MKSLSGRNVLITGGSAGIGLAVARSLARAGMHVALAARSREPLERAAAELRAMGVTVIAIPTDVTDVRQLPSLVDDVLCELGGIDVLVNNAGIETYRDFHQLELADIEQTIQLNLTAALQLTRLVIPHMLKMRRGHVVNMSSTAGKHGPPFGAAYGASKAGLIAFTQTLRTEYHGSGVSSSAICPGFAHDGGMYERMKSDTGTTTPWYLGATTAEAVGHAVVKAIQRDLAEVIVNTPPLRPAFVLAQIAPKLGSWLVRLATRHFLKKVVRTRDVVAETISRRVA
jgi:short-subunit dehydrogenase